MGDPAVQWTLTAVFAVCAALYSRGLRRGEPVTSQIAWSLHILMAVAMIAMTWSWGLRIPVIVYVVVFTAAALYFAYLAMYRERHPHATPYHFAMMASMAVMAVVMFAPGVGVTSAAAMGGMSGMSMSEKTTHADGVPTWAVTTSVIGAVAYAIAFLIGFYIVVRGPARPYANLVMAAGMAGAFAVMI